MSANIEPLAAVGYIRVSTDQQADHGIGLETQLESLRAYALIHKLNLVEIISDEGISGTIPLRDRPGGAGLLGMLGRKVRHVVALKLDRLFRNAADALAQTELWDRQGITVHLIDVGGTSINSSSAVGRMFLTMLAGFAQFERDLIAERTAAALATLRARQQVYNHVPLGYTRQGDQLVVEPGEQETIQQIMALRDGGLSYKRIADQLNDDGVAGKNGGRFYASTIHKIVGNDLHTS